MNNEKPFGMSYEYFTNEGLDSLHETLSQIQFDRKYCHYTSVSSCINLLKADVNNDFELWVSHLKYLNDKKEFDDGNNIIIERLKEYEESCNIDWCNKIISKYTQKEQASIDYDYDKYIGDIFSRDIFIMCFCHDDDLLSQWTHYGKQSGVAIEYNLRNCQYIGVTVKNEISMHLPPYNVIYEDDVKKMIIDSKIKFLDKYNQQESPFNKRKIERTISELFMLSPLFKNKYFESEKESRLVIRPLYLANQGEMREKVEFRERNGVIIPYLKIRCIGINTKVIKSLTVGPGQNQEIVFEGLKHLVSCRLKPFTGNEGDCPDIDDNSVIINGVLIKKSKIPFRG